MTDNVTPTLVDREIANLAVYRAMTIFFNEVLGRRALTATPLTVQEVDAALAQTPALKLLVVELEVAVAQSRVKERERCAKIADDIVNDCKATAPKRAEAAQAMNSAIEATAMTIASQIRTGQ